MSNDMFIDEKDTFDISIYYLDDNNELKTFEEKKDNCKSLTITFRHPDFNIAQQIIQFSTDLSDNGPVINFFKLRYALIIFLSKKWDAKDKDGKLIDINLQNIGKLKPDIAAYFMKKVQEKVGNNSLLI